MRRLALALPLALLSAGLLRAADADGEQEAKKLQGRWVATSLRQGDAEAPKGEIDKGKITLTIEGSRFTFETPKETQRGSFMVNPAASPKTIDLAVTKGGKAEAVLGIYELEGGTLRIAGQEGKRPKDFKSRLGGSIVVTLKRAKD